VKIMKSSSQPLFRLSQLVGALVLALSSHQAMAAVSPFNDYTFLDGAGDHLYYTNAVNLGGWPPVWGYNWSPSGPPPSQSSTRVFVDNNPGKSSVMQVASPYVNGTSLVGPSIGALVIDAGDAVVVGGSAPYGDNAVGYSRGDVQLVVGGALGSSITNHGTLRVSSDGRLAKLGINGEVSLTGSGQTLMSNGYGFGNSRSNFNGNQIVYGTNGWGDRLTIESGHTLRGGGYLGYNGTLAITNHGRIVADSPWQLMVSSTWGIPAGQVAANFNDGVMRAEGGGRLYLNGSIDNTGGTIEAGAGSYVDLASSTVIRNGLLRTEGDGLIRVDGYTGNQGLVGDVTLQGHLVINESKRLQVGYSAVATAVPSHISNQGLITLGGNSPGLLNSGGSGGVLRIFHDTLIDGTGQIELLDSATQFSNIEGYGGFLGRAPVLTLGAGQVLRASGVLGGANVNQGNLDIVNQGRIEAFGAHGLGVTSGSRFVNQGQFVVGTSLTITGRFENFGEFDLQAGATLTQGNVIQQDGTLTLNGQAPLSLVTLNGGLLKGSGQLQRLVQNGGTFAPGNSPGTITVEQYTLQSGGELVLEIDGGDPSQYDHLIVTGNATLLGTVVLDLSDYTGGAFSFNDVLKVGGVLTTSRNGQSVNWQVRGLAPGLVGSLGWTHQGLSLQVSSASAVPEAGGLALGLAGLGVLVAGRQMRRLRRAHETGQGRMA
jgi:hypothetical protein